MVILPRLRRGRGHPRDRPPPRDLSHRRARHVQDDPGRAETLARADVSSVRYAVVGSAEVPDELMAEFKRVFTRAEIAESYGLTEGGPVPVTNTRWGSRSAGAAAGEFPAPTSTSSTRRAAWSSGEGVGELITRNPGLAQGYWKLPEVTARKFRDGWLHTGDLMRRDADGYYYFVGRKDDMINVAGENVYPKEVEDILLRHPGLRDACVVPAPHAVKGEVPVAYVVGARGPTSEADVKAFFLERGAPYAHPRRVVFLEALPLGGTGKLESPDAEAAGAGDRRCERARRSPPRRVTVSSLSRPVARQGREGTGRDSAAVPRRTASRRRVGLAARRRRQHHCRHRRRLCRRLDGGIRCADRRPSRRLPSTGASGRSRRRPDARFGWDVHSRSPTSKCTTRRARSSRSAEPFTPVLATAT